MDVLLDEYWKVPVPCFPVHEELCWMISPPGMTVLVVWTLGACGLAGATPPGNMFGTVKGGGVSTRGPIGTGKGGIVGQGKRPNVVCSPCKATTGTYEGW